MRGETAPAGEQGRAPVDLAFRRRDRIGDPERITDIAIHAKELTHRVTGSGAGDREKWEPTATRETLDHSAMDTLTVALRDGIWHGAAGQGAWRARQGHP